MPSVLASPGVYIEEIASGVRTIIGVPTSVTAFVGRAQRGPCDQAVTINGNGDFERTFGGLWAGSRLGFSVRDFFRNGGGQAIVVRVMNRDGLARTQADVDAAKPAVDAAGLVAAEVDGAADPAAARAAVAAFPVPAGASPEATAAINAVKNAVDKSDPAANLDQLKTAAHAAVAAQTPKWDRARIQVGGDAGFGLVARDPGAWAADLRARIDTNVPPDIATKQGVAPGTVFNLTVTDPSSGRSEQFNSVTLGVGPRRLSDVLTSDSSLVDCSDAAGTAPPSAGDPWTVAAAPATTTPYQDAVEKLAADLAKADDPTPSTKAIVDLVAPWMDEVSAAQAGLDALGVARTKALQKPDGSTALADIADKADTESKARRTALSQARQARANGVSDGGDLNPASIIPAGGEANNTGLFALAKADIFNLLVIPPYKADDGVDTDVISEAAAFCEKHRAFLILDPPPDWNAKEKAVAGIGADPDQIGTRSKNAAIFFPRLRQPNPLNEMRVETFAPSGVVAGVMARTDTERGVWKAPAGLDASLVGVPQLQLSLTQAENGELNPHAVNCLRSFPPGRRVIWGSRTLDGDDRLASEWKYIPIRRLALFIEESLYRGTQWVVFEPNDSPLWASIRLNVGAFMNGLFRQGAFEGTTPRDAYFVRCDKDTNPQEDIDRGIVNILVGFAPLKPAEFVVIKLQQIAGQVEV